MTVEWPDQPAEVVARLADRLGIEPTSADEVENPNRPTPPAFCFSCGNSPCYLRGTDVDCPTYYARPDTPGDAASFMLGQLQDLWPGMTRSDIRTLLADHFWYATTKVRELDVGPR